MATDDARRDLCDVACIHSHWRCDCSSLYSRLVFYIHDLVFHDCGAPAFGALALLVPATCILFVIAGVGVSFVQAIRELCRRKKL